MKKIFLSFTLIFILVLSCLCSCNKAEQTHNNSSHQNSKIPETEYCTISYQCTSPEYNDSKKVIKGEKISAPEISCENGYFIEWFTNEECTESYNFYNAVENSFTLYGKKFKELSESFFAYDNYTPDGIIDSEEELISYIEYIFFNGIKKDENFIEVTYSEFDSSEEAIVNLIQAKVTMPTVVYGFDTKTEDGKNYIYVWEIAQIPENLKTYKAESDPEQIYPVEFAEVDDFVSQRDENFDDFKYNNLQKTVEVKSTLQLFYALEHRVKPIPVKGSSAEKALNQCKDILRKICDDSLSDLEKAKHMYLYLVKNVDYIKPEFSGNIEWADYDAFQMEGILNNGAGVCDGICKTLSALMNIEGIRCVRAASCGEANHAWNEAFINGQWFTIDATFGNHRYDEDNGTKECLTLEFFMANESIYKSIWGDTIYGNISDTMRTEIIADGVYDYYKNNYFSFNENYYDYYIESEEELYYLFLHAMDVAEKHNQTIFSVNFVIHYNPEDGFNTMIKNAKDQSGREGSILVIPLSKSSEDEINLLIVFE